MKPSPQPRSRIVMRGAAWRTSSAARCLKRPIRARWIGFFDSCLFCCRRSSSLRELEAWRRRVVLRAMVRGASSSSSSSSFLVGERVDRGPLRDGAGVHAVVLLVLVLVVVALEGDRVDLGRRWGEGKRWWRPVKRGRRGAAGRRRRTRRAPEVALGSPRIEHLGGADRRADQQFGEQADAEELHGDDQGTRRARTAGGRRSSGRGSSTLRVHQDQRADRADHEPRDAEEVERAGPVAGDQLGPVSRSLQPSNIHLKPYLLTPCLRARWLSMTISSAALWWASTGEKRWKPP